MKGKEIERKFLMIADAKFPGNMVYAGISTQNYLQSGKTEARVRTNMKYTWKTECEYELTFKGSGGLIRSEVNIELSRDQYEILSAMCNGTPVVKYYTIYELADGHSLIYSLVDSAVLAKFAYAEIEFDTEEEANNYVPSFDYIKEITHDSTYKMKNYWKCYHMQPSFSRFMFRCLTIVKRLLNHFTLKG